MNRNRKTCRKALLFSLLLLAGLAPSMPAQGASCDLYCPGGDGWTTKPVGWDTNVDLNDDGYVSVADFGNFAGYYGISCSSDPGFPWYYGLRLQRLHRSPRFSSLCCSLHARSLGGLQASARASAHAVVQAASSASEAATPL